MTAATDTVRVWFDPNANGTADTYIDLSVTLASAAPTVTALSSSSGPIAGGTSITITGTGFSATAANDTVKFGTATVSTANITAASTTSLTLTVPSVAAPAPGLVDVTVTVGGNTSATSSNDHYTYVPTVTSVSPTGGSTGGGTSVVITGTGFSGTAASNTVKFGATATATPSAASTTSLTVTAPSGTGTQDVTVAVNSVTSATSAADHYTYAAPTVTSIAAPTSVAAGSTHAITINGTNFTPGATVAVGGTAATGVGYVSATQLTATAPSKTAGVYDVIVTTGTVSTATVAADELTYVAAPTVSAVSPTSGTTGGGTSVTITGTGFSAAPGTGAVKFGSTVASYTIISNTSIAATAPAGSAGTVDVTVTTAGGTSATSASDHYTYVLPPTAAAVSATVAYDSTADAITLSLGGGAAASVAVSTAATHGTATASGTSITYTPTAGFRGTDSFQYTATNAGGTSAPATATITVSDPTITVTPTTAGSGTVGASYSQTLTASGGQSPYSFSTTLASGSLPAGLSLSSAGVISGTPTANGTFSFTVSGTDSSTGNGPKSFTSASISLTIATPTIIYVPASPASGTVGAAYSQSVASASGGTAPYSYAVTSGSLPAGLSLSTTGTLSGTPTAGGSFPIKVTTTDSSGGSGPYSTQSGTLTLVIAAPTIVYAPSSPASGTVGTAYSQSISGASGGTGPYTYALTSGALPAGMTLATNGTLSGTPTAAGSFAIKVTTTDSSTGTGPYGTQSGTLTLSIAAPTLSISPTSTASLTGAGETAYSQSFTASGGSSGASYSYALATTSGTLPTGLSFAGNTLSGTPATPGSVSFTVTATDSTDTGTGAPFTVVGAYTLTVSAPAVAVGPVTLPTPAIASAYSQNLSSSGGASPYTYSVSAGSLPAGLTLTSGTIAGTPTAAGAYSFTILATDSHGFTGSRAYSGTIAAPTIAITPATLPGGTSGTAYSQSVSASGGTSPYSYSVSVGSLPTGVTLNPSTGALSGTPSATNTYSFTIKATDSTTGTGAPFFATQAYSITTAPVLPTAGAVSATVAYNSATNPIPLTLGGGAAASVAIASGASHGTATASGTSISYTPATGYSGTDSFTYTATNTTGTSAPATVTITVTPQRPTVGVVTATVAYGSSADPITLSLGGGTAASVAVATTASHGTATASGTSITYTPAAGYSGADSFSYTATNAGGTASPATVTLTVTPQIPTVGAVSATVAFGSSANPITLALGGGTATSVAVATAASHGTATASGTAITYTPAAGYSGTDSFTYTATNTGGTAAPATVSITVNSQVPAAGPVSATVAYGSGGNPITLSLGGGTATSVAVATAATHGTALASGTAITYTPASGYSGTDSFTYTATNTSGTSSPATVSITVNPQAPTTGAVSAIVAYGSSANPITLSLSGGSATSVTVATAASHGTATASGTSITYTPASGYSGPDNFAYTAANVSGTSAPATVSITVNPQAPTAGSVSASVTGNTTNNPITLNLGGGAATSVAVATAASHGTAVASGLSITYTPASGYAGSDSFTYTAHNVTGTSAPGTVSITVTAPALSLSPSTVPAGAVAIAYGQTLTASGGTAPYSYAVTAGSLPAGIGLTTGGLLSGTATAGGSFPVTIKATDATGFSVSQAYTLAINAATVSLTPATLPAPQVNVAYSQSLSASGGVAPYQFTVASGQLPPGLALNATSGVLAGTPTTAGSYSATIQATDSSAGSGPYHASITYQLPTTAQVPVAAAITSSTPANIRDAINVGASVTGPVTSVAVASNPSHGTAAVSGLNIIYTPTTNYFGADSFTYTATGPGGTSAPATVSVTVTPLAVPVAQPLQAQVLTNTPVTLNATASASNGPFTAVAIATPPSAGTAVVAGQNIVYTPAPNQTAAATVSFTFTVSNIYGPSAPATATITVNPIPTTAASQTIDVPPSSPTSNSGVTVSLTAGAAGGPFVSATLVSVQPPNAGTVTLVPVATQTGSLAPLHRFAELLGIPSAHAATTTVAGHAFNLVFVPNPAFIGTATVTYTLANAYTNSALGEILFVVTPRADVSADADVAGLISAQVEAARRFATAQIGNFNQRLEQLHGDGPARSSNGVSVNFGDRISNGNTASADPEDNPLTRGTTDVHRVNKNDPLQAAADTSTSSDAPKHQDGGDGQSILPDGLAFWTGGSVDFGSRSSVTQRSGFNFTTDGVSAGADYRLTDQFTLGIGGGYGHDQSDIGSDGTKSVADSYSAAIYGSYHPSADTFIDGVLGYGTLNFDSTRLITGSTNFAYGHRDGAQSFGSLTGGYEYKTDTIRLTPYGRFDYTDSTLDRFSETAPGHAALTYFSQSQTTVTATLGFKGDLAIPFDWGLLLPFLRAELEHDFEGSSGASLAYTDLAAAGPAYSVGGDPVDRNHIQLGLGANLKVGGYTFGLAYENSFGIHEEQDSQIRLLVTAHF